MFLGNISFFHSAPRGMAVTFLSFPSKMQGTGAHWQPDPHQSSALLRGKVREAGIESKKALHIACTSFKVLVEEWKNQVALKVTNCSPSELSVVTGILQADSFSIITQY